MKKRLVLISLPSNGISLHNDAATTPIRPLHPPLGLMYLASAINRNIKEGTLPEIGLESLDLNFFDFSNLSTLEGYREHLHRYLKESIGNPPDYFGVSLMFSLTNSFFELLICELRLLYPASIIISGGVHATNAMDIVFDRNPGLDFILAGEGDDTLPELLKRLLAGENYSDILGLNYREHICKTLDGVPVTPPLTHNIDLDFEFCGKIFDVDKYSQGWSEISDIQARNATKVFPLIASRGCPMRCIFCANRSVHGTESRWRSIENIKGEILWLYENYGIAQFYLMDDNFTPKTKALELFAMLATLNIPNIEITIFNMSVNHTDEEIIDAVQNAGVNSITFAIETGDPEMQKKINKFCDLKKARRLIAYAKIKGMAIRCFFMLGFPGETVEQMVATIDYADSLGIDWASIFNAIPTPGTQMHTMFAKLGYIADSHEDWDKLYYRGRYFDTTEISAHDLRNLRLAADNRINFLNNRLIREGRYDEAEAFFKRFVSKMNFHIFAWDALRRVYNLTGREELAMKVLEHMKEILKMNPRAREFEFCLDALEPKVYAELTAVLEDAALQGISNPK